MKCNNSNRLLVRPHLKILFVCLSSHLVSTNKNLNRTFFYKPKNGNNPAEYCIIEVKICKALLVPADECCNYTLGVQHMS